ncbi:MAG: hypothetical protein ABI995_15035, partial [Acidobacteriota bacterium]
ARFWFPADGDSRQYELLVWIATLLSIPGMLFLWRQDRAAALILASWLALFPLVYYAIQYDPRYRLPMLWVTFALAAHALIKIGSYGASMAPRSLSISVPPRPPSNSAPRNKHCIRQRSYPCPSV